LGFEIHAIEGGAEGSERQCMIAVEEDADKQEEGEISSPETGERLELVRANARDLQNKMVCLMDEVCDEMPQDLAGDRQRRYLCAGSEQELT
jgi:hypothetical protein